MSTKKDLFGLDLPAIPPRPVKVPKQVEKWPDNVSPSIQKGKRTDYMWRLAVRPTYSVAFLARADGLPPSRNGFKDQTNKNHEGMISKKARTKINNAMQWLLMLSHKKRVYSKATKKSYWFKINFITLTLSMPQMHDDVFIKERMLYPFLRWMARSHGANLYLWKAESQVNGNIHFHITTNTFIHWKSIRRKWNSIQGKHGYLKKWTDGNVPGDPNATDVHAVIYEDEIAKYMCKYMTKNDASRRSITGRLWACSPALSNLSICIDEHDEGFAEASQSMTIQSDHKKLDHAHLLLHRPLNAMALPVIIKERLRVQYIALRKLVNPQRYFTIE